MGLRRHSLLRPRTVQTVTAMAVGTPPKLCTSGPALIHPIPAKTPAAHGRKHASGARGPRFSSHHGRAAKRRMYFFTDIADPQRLARVADSLPRQAAIGRLGQVCDRWIYPACCASAWTPASSSAAGSATATRPARPDTAATCCSDPARRWKTCSTGSWTDPVPAGIPAVRTLSGLKARPTGAASTDRRDETLRLGMQDLFHALGITPATAAA